MKFFNNILKKIDYMEASIKDLHSTILELRRLHSRDTNIIERQDKIIEKQDKIIEDLIKGQVRNESFDCVVYVPYRGRPVVIKNGEVLSDDNMTSFNVDWSFDRKTEVTVRSE